MLRDEDEPMTRSHQEFATGRTSKSSHHIADAL
jgi:hypothetical protein